MRQRMKRAGVALISVMLAGTLLAGCGGANGGGNSSSSGTAPADGGSSDAPASASPDSTSPASTETLKIEALKVGWGSKLPDEDFVKKEIDDKLNIDLKLTLPANNDEQKNQLNTRIAAGDFPDIIELIDRNQMVQLADMGALLDLTPYLDSLGDVKKLVGDTAIKKGTLDGKTYGIAKTLPLLADSYWIRKDWLDKVGMQMPTTVDELLNVATAFVEKDPDGNGKKDTLGITGSEWAAFSPIFSSFGVGSAYFDIYIKDGKAIGTVFDPAYKDALAAIKKFVDAGAVDPELFSNKGTAALDKAIKGQAGIFYGDWSLFRDERMTAIEAVNPNAEWAMVPAFEGKSQTVSSRDLGQNAGLIALPKSLEKNPDKVKRIIELLNYVSADEGLRLVEYGLEGTHYTMEDGKAAVVQDKAEEAAYTWLYQLMGRPEEDYLSTKFAKQAPQIQAAGKQPRLDVYDNLIDAPATYKKADAHRFISDELLKFAFGKSPMSEYDKFLTTLNDTYGYSQMIDEANKQLKDLGYLQ